MAELLILRKDLAPEHAADHPHRSLISTPGEIITIQEDGYPWHPETQDPGYHAIIVKIPGVPRSEVEHWRSREPEAQLANSPPPQHKHMRRHRQWHLPIDKLRPVMTSQEIEALLQRPAKIFVHQDNKAFHLNRI